MRDDSLPSIPRWQQELNIVDSTERALNEWIDITGAQPDDNIESFIRHSANTLEWIESFNIQFELCSEISVPVQYHVYIVYPPTSPHPLHCGPKHYYHTQN